jgi:transposase-like protein
MLWSVPMILITIAEKLKRQSKADFKGRHFEAWLIMQAVAWYLRYPLSYRDLEEMFRERGFEVDHSTINRWVLAYAPMIEKRLRQFCQPPLRLGPDRRDLRQDPRQVALSVSSHRQAREPGGFLADRKARPRCGQALLSQNAEGRAPARAGTNGANTFPSAIKMSVDDGFLHPDPVHYVTKHLQQGIESDHFRVKKNMPKIGGFQSFKTARRTIAGFEAMLWLRKGFGFSGGWSVNDQNDLLACIFGLKKLIQHESSPDVGIRASLKVCNRPSGTFPPPWFFLGRYCCVGNDHPGARAGRSLPHRRKIGSSTVRADSTPNGRRQRTPSLALPVALVCLEDTESEDRCETLQHLRHNVIGKRVAGLFRVSITPIHRLDLIDLNDARNTGAGTRE